MVIAPQINRILAYREPVDMRKSFAGLVALVRNVLHEDPLTDCLFVFVNRRRTILKAVYWDRTGFVILAKRLEQGRFVVPGRETKQVLDEKTLRLILDGIVLGSRARMQ